MLSPCHTAEISSPLTNCYIQLIEKMDDLLRALDPLFKKEAISIEVFGLFDLDEALVFGDGSREDVPAHTNTEL